MIEIQNVTKVYGKQTVLSCVSATLEAGRIYGLVGINGSGKTTLMRCICGFTHPTSGKIIVNGDEIGKRVDFPKRTGIIIETPGFLPHYSGLRNLLLLAGVSHGATKERAAQVMRQVKLDPDEKKPVAQYSLGMRQRLGIAQAIMEDPEILILDEPFNGLDQSGIEEIHQLFEELRKKGKTILLASHSAADISRACDCVFEIEDGILQEKSPGAHPRWSRPMAHRSHAPPKLRACVFRETGLLIHRSYDTGVLRRHRSIYRFPIRDLQQPRLRRIAHQHDF